MMRLRNIAGTCFSLMLKAPERRLREFVFLYGLWSVIIVLCWNIGGCVADDKQLAITPFLVIDNFSKRVGNNAACQFDSRFWPKADTDDTDSDGIGSDGAMACSADARPNMLGGCPENFSNQVNGKFNGTICPSYDDIGVSGPHPVLRLDFDINKDTQTGIDAFVCFKEILGKAENGPPFNLDALGLNHLTFQIMAAQENTNMEISVVSAADEDGIRAETNPKILLSDYVTPKLDANVWTKVSIPMSELLAGTDTAVNGSKLINVVFCFAYNRFVDIRPNIPFATQGTVYLNEIAFEP